MTPQQNTTAYIAGFEDGKRAAAAELRRLHECAVADNNYAAFLEKQLERLTAINAQMLESLEDCVEDSQAAVDQYVLAYGENFRPHRLKGLREIVAKARAAITAAKEQA